MFYNDDRLTIPREEYGEPSLTIVVNDTNLDFFLTCGACPEQYDVFVNDKQVGYVRLRGGALRAAYPDVHADYSYNHQFQDGWKGCFDNDNERDFYLDIIAEHLYNKFIESEVVR